MSFLTKHSNECASCELDLFTVPPTQTGIEYSRMVEHSPISKGTDGPYEFKIAGAESYYLDLSQIYVSVKCEIFDSTKNARITATDAVAPTNLFLHSMFQEVEVSLNGEGISQSTKTHPFKNYFLTLLNYGRDAKESHLQAAMYFKDDANEFNNIEIDTTKKNNSGFISRRKIALKGPFKMHGKLQGDLFCQEKYLLDKVPLEIKLNLSPSKFCLVGSDDKFKVKVLDVKIFARHCKISSSVYLAHALALEKATAKYPIRRVLMKTFSINKGVGSHNENVILCGRLPNRVVFGLLDDETFNGSITKNCYNFQNFAVTEVAVLANNSHVPESPLKLDFDTIQYTNAYYSLFTGIDKAPLDCGNDISLGEYPNGYTLYAFDLTPDMCQGDHLNIQRSGSLDIGFTFKTVPASNLICVVYMEFDNLIEVCKNRTVMKDYQTVG